MFESNQWNKHKIWWKLTTFLSQHFFFFFFLNFQTEAGRRCEQKKSGDQSVLICRSVRWIPFKTQRCQKKFVDSYHNFFLHFSCLFQKKWLWLLKSIDRTTTTTTTMTIQLSEKITFFFGLVIIYWSFINHDNDNDNKKKHWN